MIAGTIPHLNLDVRPILAAGDEPFNAIMQAVAALAPGQSLRLLAPFKPIPLFQVLGARGYQHSAREIGGGDWEVIFTPADVAGSFSDQAAGDGTASWPEPRLRLDNRELDPPEPMVKTLEAVETLEPGDVLVALLPREPLFLFDELRVRGHAWQGGFDPDGSYRIVIRAKGDKDGKHGN